MTGLGSNIADAHTIAHNEWNDGDIYRMIAATGDDYDRAASSIHIRITSLMEE